MVKWRLDAHISYLYKPDTIKYCTNNKQYIKVAENLGSGIRVSELKLSAPLTLLCALGQVIHPLCKFVSLQQ